MGLRIFSRPLAHPLYKLSRPAGLPRLLSRGRWAITNFREKTGSLQHCNDRYQHILFCKTQRWYPEFYERSLERPSHTATLIFFVDCQGSDLIRTQLYYNYSMDLIRYVIENNELLIWTVWQMVNVEEYVDETVLPVVDESTLLTEKPRFENSANRSLWNCTAPGHGTGGSQSRSSCPRSWEVWQSSIGTK